METPRSDKRGRSGGAGARSLMPDDDKDDPMSARRGPNPFISNPHAHPQFAPQKLGARGVSEGRARGPELSLKNVPNMNETRLILLQTKTKFSV